MTKTKSIAQKSKPISDRSPDRVRASIVHPTLIDAFDTDWYYPWTLPEEAKKEKGVQRAIKEGWSEWIESPEDLEAVRMGYVFDLSRDKQGKPIYWHKGQWVRYQGSGKNRRLVAIPGNEESHVGYCGAGDHFCRFVESTMHHTKGEIQGQSYRFMAWQRKLVMTLFGWVSIQVNKDGRRIKHRRYREALVEIPKKNAKLLSDDTVVPTPSGWKRHGDLVVGDRLFDARGRQCEVIAVHPKGHATHWVEFTNGEAVAASAEHRWITERLDDRKYTSGVRETWQIAATLKTSQGANRHRVVMHGGLNCDATEIPLDPYVFGYWLGDGSQASAEITMSKEDFVSVLGEFLRRGFEPRKFKVDDRRDRVAVNWNYMNEPTTGEHKLRRKLAEMGQQDEKHIPPAYLRASESQRLELLQGLMDSDGTISKNGKCICISQKRDRLARNIGELLASLGIKYSITKRHCLETKTQKRHWSYLIQFHVFKETHQVFRRIPRKLARMRSTDALEMKTGRSRHVHINAVTELESPIQGNCITVSSADGSYLFGHTMLPTHNSDLASIVAVYLVRADGVEKSYVFGCASDKNQAGIVYKEALNYVNESEFLKEELQPVESKKRLVHHESASYYEVVSADAYRNDGYDAVGVIFDELHRQPNRKLFTVMKRSGRARPGKHLRFVTTTYGETLKGIWGEEHLKAKDQLAGRKKYPRRLVMIASAEPITVVTTATANIGATSIDVWRLEQPISAGEVMEFDSPSGGTVTVTLTAKAKRFQSFIECEPITKPLPEFAEAEANKDWRSDDAIRRANPSVDIVFPIEEIREDIAESVGPEAEAEAKQLSLNIVSGGGRRAISGAVWQANGRHRVLMSSLIGQRCFGAGDFSMSNDLTAFWLAFPSWPHNVKYAKAVNPMIRLIGLVWVPEEGIEAREEREEVPYRAYAEAPYIGDFGFVRICPGAVVDWGMVGKDIVDFCSRFKVQAIGFDPAYSNFVVEPYLLPAGLKCIVHRTGMMSMAPAVKRFEELLLKKQIAHGNHPLLDVAATGAMYRKDTNGNKMWCKDKSTTRVDPLAAATMATGWACDPPVELKGTGAWTGKGTGAFG